MIVAIAVLVLAFAGPVRRYVRRRMANRRARRSARGIPPYWVPSAPGSKHQPPYSESVSTQSHGYRSKGGASPQREGGLAYLNSGGLGSYSVVGTPSDPDPHSPPTSNAPPGPEIRTLFAANAAVSTRQESWERRIREQYNKQGWFARNIWPRNNRTEDEPEKQRMAVDSSIGRAI